MSERELKHLLAPAVDDVLEMMFFSETFGPCELDSSGAGLEANVAFAGETSGSVGVRISQASARCLTASFLGESEDALTGTQIAQVVCELTNMLCGCIVSKMTSQGCFNLDSPELPCKQREQSKDTSVIQQSFAIEHGTLTVLLCLSASE
jgi:CheY-specific phosphatase CheX